MAEGLPQLPFHTHLVKPDMQIARIPLSPASSGFRARHVGSAEWQPIQAKRLVEILVRILAVSGAACPLRRTKVTPRNYRSTFIPLGAMEYTALTR